MNNISMANEGSYESAMAFDQSKYIIFDNK